MVKRVIDLCEKVENSRKHLGRNTDPIIADAKDDLVAIMSAGAYGAVQASTYNTRALVPEVLVRKGEWALVRPRVSVQELIALDRMPAWL